MQAVGEGVASGPAPSSLSLAFLLSFGASLLGLLPEAPGDGPHSSTCPQPGPRSIPSSCPRGPRLKPSRTLEERLVLTPVTFFSRSQTPLMTGPSLAFQPTSTTSPLPVSIPAAYMKWRWRPTTVPARARRPWSPSERVRSNVVPSAQSSKGRASYRRPGCKILFA